jgi:AcrR family transcriptional regulator
LNTKGHKKAVPRPSKGIQTRQEVIARAVKIAAQEGLGALSIGRLAKELRMSKSGLFIHFGSKEALEVAVIERAELYFYDHIMVPIEQEGREGIERVWYLCEAWLDLVENEILSGGYFFTGAFFTCAWQGGPIPRQVRRFARDWIDTLAAALKQARRQNEVAETIDAEDTAFELNSMLIGAQWSRLMTHRDHTNARSAILAKLHSVATEQIPGHAFESVKAWTAYLKHRGR